MFDRCWPNIKYNKLQKSIFEMLIKDTITYNEYIRYPTEIYIM